MQEKVPTSMHSVRLEPTKLTLAGTRTTYEDQTTGDAGTSELAMPCALPEGKNQTVIPTYTAVLYLKISLD